MTVETNGAKAELSAMELLDMLKVKVEEVEERQLPKDAISDVSTTKLMQLLSARLKRIGVQKTSVAMEKHRETKAVCFELNQFFHDVTDNYR